MKRKLVRQGGNALTITLPSKWIREKGLTPKDEVEVEEYDGDLVVKAKAKEIIKRVSLELKSSNQKYIKAMFRNLYINGYDEINVRFESEDDLFSISRSIEPLIGYEIDIQKEKSCVVRNVSPTESDEYESMFKKIFYTAFMMKEIVDKALVGDSTKIDAEKMDQLNKNSSKFSCFCRRVIFKTNLSKNEEGVTKYSIINIIHMIARNYASIFNSKCSLKKESIKYKDEVGDFLREVFDAYCKKDMGVVEDILGKRKELILKGFDVLKKDTKNAIVLHYLMEIVRLTGTIAGKIGFLNSLDNKF